MSIFPNQLAILDQTDQLVYSCYVFMLRFQTWNTTCLQT